jgi:hypothetical protein
VSRREAVPALLVAALVALLALTLAGCGSGPPASVTRMAAAASSPSPASTADAVAAALGADDALRAAYAEADDRPLLGLFGGPALAAARRDLAGLAARGARREERLVERRVVHQAPAGADAEVVLQVRAEQRLVTKAADPPWVTVLRQWRVRVHRGAAGWVVEEDQDLRPDQWWPPPA